jgi:hypothetical protein
MKEKGALTGPMVLQLSRVRALPTPAGGHWRIGEPHATPLGLTLGLSVLIAVRDTKFYF